MSEVLQQGDISVSSWIFKSLFFYFPKKLGQSGDGKWNILWEWAKGALG